MDPAHPEPVDQRVVHLPVAGVELEGSLSVPDGATGVVLFAHGSGSSRHSPRNRQVAGALNDAGIATLLIDLLTADEERVDEHTRHIRFDIGLLAGRLVGATGWLRRYAETSKLPIGYFGASTGAAAAMVAAAELPDEIRAVVSRGGRPDLAAEALPRTRAPTLLIVGGNDGPVIGMNEQAMRRIGGQVALEVVPGAGHLFEEPGTLEEVARMAVDWFQRHLTPRVPAQDPGAA